MFTPMLLLGINTGVLLNAMFPDYLITLLLVLIIAAMAHKSISRGLLLRRKENALRLSKKALQVGINPNFPPLALKLTPSCSSCDAAVAPPFPRLSAWP